MILVNDAIRRQSAVNATRNFFAGEIVLHKATTAALIERNIELHLLRA